jgi:hypothetical protein
VDEIGQNSVFLFCWIIFLLHGFTVMPIFLLNGNKKRVGMAYA